MDSEQADLVDTFYASLVRPLGNLVILFAQAEAALVDLLMTLNGENENLAHSTLKAPDAKEQILTLVKTSGLEGFDLIELLEDIEKYWTHKDQRNRYIHDEWWIGLYRESITPSTRGLPRKKGSVVVWDQPTPEDVWGLALKFREHEHLFSHRAYVLRREGRAHVK